MRNATTHLWGGRFAKLPSPALRAISRFDPSHLRLAPQDIAGSRAHARELERAGLLTPDECGRIIDALDAIGAAIADGSLKPRPDDEDIHSFLERALVECIGPLGGKLRAGRSRNDQAANDLKIFLRQEARVLARAVLDLVAALTTRAEEHRASPAPGFTHLQTAQPVAFGHQLLVHAQALTRDVERLRDFDRRAARSPLGAAALAGSAVALRPDLSAVELGYEGPCENSIDAVGNRDHVAEFLFVTAMIGVGLSRLSEEITLWSSAQFGWIGLDDGYSTGSSIMPQKKNPDIAEIARGRSARLIGDLTTMLVAMKGLPFAYNRDLAEDKRAVFDAVDTLALVLPGLTGLVETMEIRAGRIAEQAAAGFSLATEVADWLARQGVPFADAHEITGRLVRHCEERGIGLEDLDPSDLARVDARLGVGVMPHLTPQAALAARQGHGGTAPERVAEQIVRLRQRITVHAGWAAAPLVGRALEGGR